jgi:hypothetical protein
MTRVAFSVACFLAGMVVGCPSAWRPGLAALAFTLLCLSVAIGRASRAGTRTK